MDESLVWRTAQQQLRGMRRGEFSAQELLTAHLDQIARVNPLVNAVVTLDVDGAIRSAAAVDAAFSEGRPVGPLAGLPISFKDTHATAGLRTTYGSPLYAEHVPTSDEELVRRLEAAGVVRVGKTNVPEFAAGSHTFNTVFGTTRNPYDLTRSAGGSSGGAAAALACGMQSIADGSDMGGSLRNPASFCNVVGMRPTPGRVPDTTGQLPQFRLSVAGPMARTVSDVGLMYSVIIGQHRDDPLSLCESSPISELVPEDLTGLRVAWAPTLGDRINVDHSVLETLESAISVLTHLGARVETACPDLHGADHAFRTLRAAEFDHMWATLLRLNPTAFKADLAWNIRQGSELSGREIVNALTECTRLQRAAETFFDRFDVLVAPVSQVAGFDAELNWPTEIGGAEMHTYLDWMAASYLLSPLGVPALSVPAGFTREGLPVGLQMLTRARTDRKLLRIAAAFEEATGYGTLSPRL